MIEKQCDKLIEKKKKKKNLDIDINSNDNVNESYQNGKIKKVKKIRNSLSSSSSSVIETRTQVWGMKVLTQILSDFQIIFKLE